MPIASAVAGGDPLEVLDVAHRVDGGAVGQVVAVGGAAPGRLAGMGLDQLATPVDPHQLAVGADVDALTDQVAGDRVERLGHFDVMIAVDLRRRVERHVVAPARRWQQPRQLLEREQLGGTALRRAVDPMPGALLTPLLGAPPSQRDQVRLLGDGVTPPVLTWCTQRGLSTSSLHPRLRATS